MPTFKFLGNEPAVITAVVSAALSLVVTLGVGLTSDQAGGWVAVISGLFAVVAAWHTRPVAPAVFTGLVTVTAALLSSYHFHVAPGTVGAINTLVIAVLTLLTRGQVAPVTAKAPAVASIDGPAQL